VIDTAFQPASQLAAALRDKEISSRELLDLYLSRLEKLNPRLNAVVTLDEERARERARDADEALARGGSWGPLHGLPMTVKDTFETAGVRTTAGSPDYADHVPTADADAVRRLRDAGAVVFGKTNMPALGADYQSFNEVFGCTNNPWDEGRTPGGSSGGSAAALAAGLTGLELGSDIAGSARIPASWCGVYGLKPSHGVVSDRGHIPGKPGRITDMDLVVMGPMGRSADDLELGLDVIAGPGSRHDAAWSLRLPPARRQSLREYRIAAWLDDPFCPVDGEVGDTIAGAIEALRAAGAQIVESPGPVPLAEAFDEFYFPSLMAFGSDFFPQDEFDFMVDAANADPDGEMGALVPIAKAMTMRVRDWNMLQERRAVAMQRWAEFFTRYDALLCPVSPTVAIAHDHREMDQRTVEINGEPRPYGLPMLIWTQFANVFGLPATAAPVGQAPSGLPVGLQIVGPYLEDRTPVDLARRLAEVTGGFQPPPGV
jgi:amidase